MRIVCKNNGDDYWDITIGKTYDVIEEYKYYKIINDSGKEEWFVKYWFKPLSEVRNEKIDKLLEDES